MRMDPIVKAAWVEALRSDEYARTHATLHFGGGFCCLGVLCELHRRELGGEWEEYPNGQGRKRYMGAGGRLPVEVQAWAGLMDDDPVVSVPIDPRTRQVDAKAMLLCGTDVTLSALNDGVPGTVAPHTFAQIADVIEGHL